jgi:23S rRNA (uracil1939-C5)-methyltransferase
MGGLGLGHLENGLVALVPHTLPGETVLVKPVRKKKSYLEARLLEVLEPSVDRETPACPFFDSCGGCNFQHVEYSAQPGLKSVILGEQLMREHLFAEEELPTVLTSPLPSPLAFNYRQRIRLKINDNGEYGFLRHHSHKIVPVNHCLLAREEINQILARLDEFSSVRHLLGLSSRLELQLSPVDKKVFLLFHFSRKPRPADIKAAEKSAVQLDTGGIILLVKGYGRYGPYPSHQETSTFLNLKVNVPGKKIYFHFEPGTFCQVNLAQNKRLVTLLLEWAAVEKNERVLDLFCGMGNFSLPLALAAREVVGMDLQRSAIRSARKNADRAGLDNCRFERLAAEQGAKQCLSAKGNFDLILLDPPRTGCREVIPHILKINPARIIYISCDPATLCRDLGMLTANGYKISRIKMVDMFPQTHHLESITLLSAETA